MSIDDAPALPSTKPYLIRALYEWCEENGFTPYLAVMVDDSVQVPHEYVSNGEIVLNISSDATKDLNLGNDWIDFNARFAGVPREISVPVGKVIAIYAKENGQGMSFPVYELAMPNDKQAKAPSHPVLTLLRPGDAPELATTEPSSPEPPTTPPKRPRGKPKLKLVK